MEDERYLVEGEIVFISYMPAKLKVGMHFVTRLLIAGEPEFLFFTLGDIPEDQDMFMKLYGAPVHIKIVSSDDGDLLVDDTEIGWFNDGKENTELRDITDEEISLILTNDEGFVDIECDDTGDVILYEGKAILSFLSEDEETLEDG